MLNWNEKNKKVWENEGNSYNTFFSLLCRSMKRIVVVMKECIWKGERRQCENHRGEKKKRNM